MRSFLPVAIVALTMTLVACVPEPDAPRSVPASPVSSAPPLFADEEEALAAAEAAYREFVSVGEAITADGGKRPERMQPLSTPELFEKQTTTYERFVDKAQRTTGNSELLDVRLQRWSNDEVVIYACQDFTAARLRDASGNDITPADRPNIATFEVTLVPDGGTLLIADSQLWSHGSSCF